MDRHLFSLLIESIKGPLLWRPFFVAYSLENRAIIAIH
jgi:hypothetical protein